jgi:hypothetical protein
MLNGLRDAIKRLLKRHWSRGGENDSQMKAVPDGANNGLAGVQ